MTLREANEAIESLRKEGHSDEDIAASFYLMFSDKRVDLNQFKALLAVLGYELSEDFLKLSEEEQRKIFLNNK